ncbi:MAG: MFS transporter [Candidatus Midichloria sp.]|nr:MFS transporter [Candidatus Midichloria sp.]
MAIPTTLIGLLPTYENIGIWAPIILTGLRIAQGLAIGGEFTGSTIILVEHAPNNKKGFHGSIATFSAVVGVMIGSIVASLIFYMCEQEQLYSFG